MSDHVKNANVKRITSFIKFINENPSPYYEAKPSDEDMFIWYIKVKGLSDEYSEGEYIMKIHFTDKYPFEAPDYYNLTPSGRFEVGKKICFSNSGYHADSWSPLWGIHQIIMGIISFYYERNSAGISHINNSSEEQRKVYAIASKDYNKKYFLDKYFE